MVTLRPPTGGTQGPDREYGSYPPEQNTYEPQSTHPSAPPDSYVSPKEETPSLQLIASAGSAGVAQLLAQPRLTQSAINERVELLASSIAQDLRRDDPLSIDINNDRRIISTAIAYLREHFDPLKTGQGRPPADKLITDSLRYGFRDTLGRTPGRNNYEIGHLISPFARFVHENAAALEIVGTRLRAKRLGGRPSARSAPSTIPPPFQDSAAYPLGGLRELLAPWLPRDSEGRARFEDQFESATNYTLTRFMLWGSARQRPAVMSGRIWETLLALSKSDEETFELLLAHPEKNITDPEVWQKTVERARATAGFASLGAKYVPDRITDDDWNRYVEARLSDGHPEDVAVEPRTGEALSAMLPAYLFLRSQGFDVNAVDYLSAIYPLFGELVANARSRGADGSIRIEVPLSIMGDKFSLRDLTYETWAKQIEQQAFPTLVLKRTLSQHADGLHNPVYRNVERYAKPLAASVGATPERERTIYLFLATLPRAADILYHTTAVYGPNGEMLSAPMAGSGLGPAIHIINDEARYPTGYRAPTNSRRNTLQLDVRRGAYRAMLELSGKYLAQIQSVHEQQSPQLTFSYSDGRMTSLAELMEHHRSFALRIDGFDKQLFDNESAKGADLRDVNDFYLDLRGMAEDLFFFVRVRGQMPSVLGPLPFIAAVRMEGRRTGSDDSAVLFLNDIALKAGEENWGQSRTNAVTLMRIYAWHALNRGYISAENAQDPALVASATRAFLKSEEPWWEQAALDYVQMEKEQATVHLRDTIGDVHHQRHGANADIVATLRNSLPHEPAPVLAADAAAEPVIARRAVESYVALFPQERDVDSGIPIDPALVRLFVDLESSNYQAPRRELAALQALDALERYNEQRGAPPIALANDATALPTQGLALQRFELFSFEWSVRRIDKRSSYNRDAVWNAFWRLREKIISGETVDDDDIHRAIAVSSQGVRTNGTEAGMLAHIVAKHQRDLKTFRELMAAPWLGLTSFVRERFVARYITDEALQAFAERYVSHRLTSVSPVDTDGIVAEALGDAFVPHLDITEKMAAFYRTLVGRWFTWAEEQLSSRVEEGMLAIDTVAEDADNLPPTVEILMLRAADLAGAVSFDDLVAAEQKLLLLRELLGDRPSGEPLKAAALRTYSERVIPAQEARRARMGREFIARNTSLETELSLMAREVSGHLERSAKIFIRAPEILEMDERAVTAFMASIQSSFNNLSDIQRSHLHLGDLSGKAARIAEQLGHGEGAVRTIRENMVRAEQNIARAQDQIVEAHAAGKKRQSELRQLSDVSQAERRAAEAQADAEALIESLERSLQELEELRANDVAQSSADFEKIKQSLNQDSPADVLRFAAAVQASASLSGSTSGIMMRLDVLRSQIVELIEVHDPSSDAPSLTSHASQRLVDAMAAAVDDARWNELAATAGRLSTAIHNGGRTADDIQAIIQGMETRISELADALSNAENRLPIGPMAGLDLSKQGVAPAEEGRYDFASEAPEGNYDTRAQNALKPLLFGRILSRRGEARQIGQQQASLVDGWLKSGRRSPLSIRDAFGNTVEIAKEERGIRLANHEELPQEHPLHRLINTLGAAVAENSAEAGLIALFAREGLRGGRSHALLLDLFANLASRPIAGAPSEARGIVREWALSNRARIVSALRKPAKIFFVSKGGPAPITISSIGLRPPSYTPDEHARLARRFARLIEHPEFGTMIANLPDGTRRFLNVDVLEVRQALQEGKRSVRHFDLDDGKWMSFDLRLNGIASLDQLALDSAPVALQPERLALMRLMWRIHSDPALIDLGWIASAAADASMPIHHMLQSTLKTIAHAEQRPGGKPPLDLHAAQNEMRGAYKELAIGAASLPEAERVKKPVLLDWLARIGPSAGKIRELIESSPTVRRMAARVFLMHEWSTRHGNESDAAEIRETFAQVEELMLSHREQREAALEKFMRDDYLSIRPAVIADSELMQSSTGLHAPQLIAPFTAPDAELARLWPETGSVGGSQVWALVEALKEGHGCARPGLVRMFDAFPEFANALTMISLTYERLRPELLSGIEAIAADYDSMQGVKGRDATGAFRRRFIELYGAHGQEIRAAMASKQVEGMTAAEWLTGHTDPWTDKSEWKGYSPIERLYGVAPEFARMIDAHVQQILQKIRECEDSTSGVADRQKNLVKSMLMFAEAHPEFSKPIALLTLLFELLPEKIICDKIVPFFLKENGQWSNSSAAAAFASANAAELAPEQEFVNLLIRPQTLAALRAAMQRPPARHSGPSIAVVFQGSDRPWLPDPEALAISDRMKIPALSGRELIAHIERQLVETKHLYSPTGIRKNPLDELNAKVDFWLEREQIHAESGNDAILFVGSEATKRCLCKMMLVLESAAQSLAPTQTFRGMFVKFMEQNRSDDDVLRFAYNYLIDHRDQIIEATAKPKKSSGNDGGTLSPLRSAPKPSASAESGPPPSSAALSSGADSHDSPPESAEGEGSPEDAVLEGGAMVYEGNDAAIGPGVILTPVPPAVR